MITNLIRIHIRHNDKDNEYGLRLWNKDIAKIRFVTNHFIMINQLTHFNI